MLRIIKNDIKRSFSGIYFYIAVLMFFLIGWLQLVGENDTALSVLLGASSVQEPQLIDFYLMVGYAGSSWFRVTLAAACAICASAYFCDERTSGMSRLVICRTNFNKYIISRFISAVISAVMAMLFGYILFSCSVFFTSGSFADLPTDLIEIELEYYTNGKYFILEPKAYIFLVAAVMKCFAAILYQVVFWAEICLCIAAVKPNKYFTIILPMAIVYFWNRLSTQLLLDRNPISVFIYDFPSHYDFAYFSNNYGLSDIVTVIIEIAVFALRLILPMVLFCFIMNRKVDVGCDD